MLTILGRRTGKAGRLCDGISRRGFLTIAGMALGGLALLDVLRAEMKNEPRPLFTAPSSLLLLRQVLA